MDVPVFVQHSERVVEEGKVKGEIGVVVKANEGIDVDGEWGSVVAQELHDLYHQGADVWAEIPIGREIGLALVHVGIERNCDLDPGAKAGLLNRRVVFRKLPL